MQLGIKGYRACVRIVLRPHHRRTRLTWTQLHSRWSRAQWSNVVFSDEFLVMSLDFACSRVMDGYECGEGREKGMQTTVYGSRTGTEVGA